jgi:hypothetical protein
MCQLDVKDLLHFYKRKLFHTTPSPVGLLSCHGVRFGGRGGRRGRRRKRRCQSREVVQGGGGDVATALGDGLVLVAPKIDVRVWSYREVASTRSFEV